jgi:hypothetical protein
MDPGPRRAFNRAWTPELYARYCARLERALGPIPFRLAETPFFISPALRDSMTRSAGEIVDQLSRPALLAELKQIIPGRYDTPGMDPLPNCVQVDFAITPAPAVGWRGGGGAAGVPSGYAR